MIYVDPPLARTVSWGFAVQAAPLVDSWSTPSVTGRTRAAPKSGDMARVGTVWHGMCPRGRITWLQFPDPATGAHGAVRELG